jgi:predicted CXXCH cytochrome family protein
MTRRIPPVSALALAALAATGAVALAWLALDRARESAPSNESTPSPAATASPPPPNPHLATATFVGSAVCAQCHEDAAATWRISQHARAMQAAAPSTVLGDFSGVTVRESGNAATFVRRGDRFFVRTDGADGTRAEFEVRYTFGIEPLQQYLVPMPGGRLQALPFAWDTRSREQGGQRWFHLRPGERVAAGDELHWTRANANWNYMCADCHSTDVRRNYDAAKDAFATTFGEVAVGCEVCHGPGSAHVAWGRVHDDDATKGLTVALTERAGVRWTMDRASGIAVRSRPRDTDRELAVCAPCHARRSQVAEGWRAGAELLDHYRPALLEPGLYHADGQQRDEVFTWGSFLQSRMNHAGVTCSDCHEPHGGVLRAPGNRVCAQCHWAPKYDSDTHHHHGDDRFGPQDASGRPGRPRTHDYVRADGQVLRGVPTSVPAPGTQCVDCHMPAATYMVVDPRRDHSFRVPRPDESVALGTPNACNACHADRDAAWARAAVERWYGRAPTGFQRHGSAFRAAEVGAPDAQAKLVEIVGDASHPAFVRASALAQLGAWASPTSAQAALVARRDPDALVRLGAIRALDAFAPADRLDALAPLLDDPVRVVRIDAADTLAGGLQGAAPAIRASFDRAAAEYEAAQRLNGSRAESHLALGAFRWRAGRVDDARAEYETALKLDPRRVPAYVNFADLYRAQGADAQAEAVLREGLRVAGDHAVLRHALGLTLVRLHRPDEALRELAAAARLAPDDGRFAYAYALALDSAGRRDDARRELQRALVRQPRDSALRSALEAFGGERSAAPE